MTVIIPSDIDYRIVSQGQMLWFHYPYDREPRMISKFIKPI